MTTENHSAVLMNFTTPDMGDYLVSVNRKFGGHSLVFKFPNGYGASVIRHDLSCGGESGLWELAVLGRDGALCYTTPITGDVLGWLNESEVDENLLKIKAL